MTGKARQITIAALALMFPVTVIADYVATGDIEGQECIGVGIESCSFVDIDAVEGEGGRLYTVKSRYREVTEYSSSKGRCWVDTKTKRLGVLGWAIDAVSGPTFYTEAEGGFEEVDVDYITFPCREE